MKTPTRFTALGYLFFIALGLISCHRDEIPQYTLELTQGDGTRESYTFFAGGMLLVRDGDKHLVIKTTDGNSKEEIGLDVTSYTMAEDTTKRELTIQKSGTNNQRISLTKSALLDPAGTVQINLQSVTMQKQATQNPKGKCKGNCCEAKCFSLWCCVDPDECKNVPCDCKPPSGCPGPPSGTVTAFVMELFRSGKDMMVFKI